MKGLRRLRTWGNERGTDRLISIWSKPCLIPCNMGILFIKWQNEGFDLTKNGNQQGLGKNAPGFFSTDGGAPALRVASRSARVSRSCWGWAPLLRACQGNLVWLHFLILNKQQIPSNQKDLYLGKEKLATERLKRSLWPSAQYSSEPQKENVFGESCCNVLTFFLPHLKCMRGTEIVPSNLKPKRKVKHIHTHTPLSESFYLLWELGGGVCVPHLSLEEPTGEQLTEWP